MDPYSEQEPGIQPNRRRHDCLWGCLTVLIAVAAVIAIVYSYGAHHLFGKLRDDVHVQTIMDALNQSDEAKAVLGRNISVQSRKAQTYSYQTGRGGTAFYVLTVVGSGGQGEVKTELDVSGPKDKITLLVLTDDEGHEHYIVGAAPPNPLMQNSI